jgi:hypothetical protein
MLVQGRNKFSRPRRRGTGTVSARVRACSSSPTQVPIIDMPSQGISAYTAGDRSPCHLGHAETL